MYLFDSGYNADLSGNLDVYYPVSEEMSEAGDVNFLWNIFKNRIKTLVDMFVLSRSITSRHGQDTRWINSELLKPITTQISSIRHENAS